MTGEDLVSLVYTSTASQPFRESALEELLTTSRRLNAERDVTGMLLYRDGRFIQVLAGERAVVTGLAQRIAADSRHHDMRVLLTESIPRRTFGEWTMGYRAIGGPAQTPLGYRDSFADLDAGSDSGTVERALAELTLWFRVRSGASVGATR
jgi:hypothetical protein